MREKIKAIADRVTLKLQMQQQQRRQARPQRLAETTNNMDVDESESDSDEDRPQDNEVEEQTAAEGTEDDPLLATMSDMEVDNYLSYEGDSMHVDSEDSTDDEEICPPTTAKGDQAVETAEQQKDILWKTPRTGQRRPRDKGSGKQVQIVAILILRSHFFCSRS